jgi:hypothetical protein
MAIAQQAWELQVQLIDTGGNTALKTYQLQATDVADDITAVRAGASDILAKLIAVTDAKVKAYRIVAVYVEDALTLPTAAEVENNLQISAKIDGIPNKSAVIEIPAPKAALFQAPTGAGYNQPDFSVTALGNFVNEFKTGANAFVSDGEVITDQDIKGRRVHHKSTKG